ncbi:MAG TPA: phage minor head protein, partial [Acidimicrobiia bacterium]|nr:phage minor head protein [Acidimicrobiia bacterium]
ENTVLPRLMVEQQTLDRQLFMGRGQGDTASSMRVWAEPDLSGVVVLQTEESERRVNAEADRRLGFALNEINERHQLGYEPDQPSGDVGLVSGGLVPVTAVAFEFPEEEPPEPEPEPAPEEPEDDPDEAGDDDEGRAAPPPDIRIVTSYRPGEAERAVLWHRYIRGIQRPGEMKMRAALIGWMRNVRRDTLRFVEQSTRGVRTMTDLELAAFLSAMERQWKTAIVNKTRPATEFVVNASLKSLAAQIGQDMPNATSPEMLRFMEAQGTRKIRVEETVQTAIRSELLEGIGQRENVTQLQARVKSVMNVAASRSLTIARTETGSASTGSRYEASKDTGVQRIMWVTARDEAVRETHQELDGVERNFGDPFGNGLRYPLDNESGEAGEVINCRCDWIALKDGIVTV